MQYNFKNGIYYVDKSFPQKKKKNKNSANIKKRNTAVNQTAEIANESQYSKINTHANNVGSKLGKTEIISSGMIVIDGGMSF